jgi:hypothetical protein
LEFDVRLKSVILGFAATGAMLLGPIAAATPASAAPVASSSTSTGVIAPDSAKGARLCDGPYLCVQRYTTVVDGTAYVEAWADTKSFTGIFVLFGPGGRWMAQSKVETWIRGGPGEDFEIPAGGGYNIQAQKDGVLLGSVDFSV